MGIASNYFINKIYIYIKFVFMEKFHIDQNKNIIFIKIIWKTKLLIGNFVSKNCSIFYFCLYLYVIVLRFLLYQWLVDKLVCKFISFKCNKKENFNDIIGS